MNSELLFFLTLINLLSNTRHLRFCSHPTVLERGKILEMETVGEVVPSPKGVFYLKFMRMLIGTFVVNPNNSLPGVIILLWNGTFISRKETLPKVKEYPVQSGCKGGGRAKEWKERLD